MNSRLIVFACFLIAATLGGSAPLCAQQKLELIDVLPPFNLSATLLDNGDFSIRTAYGSATAKHIIYEQDGASTNNVNYTSHFHFKIDSLVYELPYENDSVTGLPPPPHALQVLGLFADTIAGNPRINASLLAMLPNGDSMRFVFTMEPSVRPSGGFIKISAAADNRSTYDHTVGALFFFDTKIDTNDEAPIATAYGYSDLETDFTATLPPGIPDFWLAMEGTPKSPGLTARGNLTAPGLMTPDYLMFGNWSDFGGGTVKGLNDVVWNERGASHLKYYDSGILLRWEPMPLSTRTKRVLASTEIGVIDSLKVTQGSGGGSGGGTGGGPSGGGLFAAGPGACDSVSLNVEYPCGEANYSPYSPDSIQFLYLLSNTNPQQLTGAQIVAPQLPRGVQCVQNPSNFIPSALDSGMTGVGTISFYAAPRLHDTTVSIPIQITTTAGSATVSETICLTVPGILPKLSADPVQFSPLCPGNLDTATLILKVDGVRCLPVDSIRFASAGNASDTAQFKLLAPEVSQLPGSGLAQTKIQYDPNALNTQRVRVIFYTHEFESPDGNDTTFVQLSDTILVTGIGKNAEFSFAAPTDTLGFGKICVGDSGIRDWPILNQGGCEVTIDSAKILNPSVVGEFVVDNALQFPMSIQRASKGGIGKATVKFAPSTQGAATAQIVIWSNSKPGSDTLALKGFGDVPSYLLAADSLIFDTVCPGVAAALPMILTNPSVCTAEIDSITISSPDSGFTVMPRGAFAIGGGNGTAAPQIGGQFSNTGTHIATATVHSKLGDKSFSIRAVTATRSLAIGLPVDFGDVLLGQTQSLPVTVTSSGTAGVSIRGIQVVGANGAEFTTNGTPASPKYLPPGANVTFMVNFTPANLEEQIAQVVFDMDPAEICEPPNVLEIKGRGIQPLVDVPVKVLDAGRLCAGDTVITTFLVRNPGNAALSISGITGTGPSDFAIRDALPILIDSNASKPIAVRFIPSMLGPETMSVTITSNGKWLTAPDTTITIQGTGILCGTLSVDTVRGIVGDVVQVPVRFRPSNAATDAAALMNGTSAQAMDFSISHNPRMFRFTSDLSSGMLLGTSATVTPAPSLVQVQLGVSSPLMSDSIVAMLRGDVLLGDDFETPLTLTAPVFANGYSNVQLQNGLLIASSCALDHRYLASTPASYIVPQSTPLPVGGNLILSLLDDAVVSVDVYDAIGQHVLQPVAGSLTKGTYLVPLREPATKGFYIIELRVDGVKSSIPVLVE